MGRELLAFWLAPAVPPIFPAPEAQGSLYGYSLGWICWIRQPGASRMGLGVPQSAYSNILLVHTEKPLISEQ